ncbi:MAG TPA: hypothetical protein VEW11_06190 [Gaiellaceae bacterium]|nr:hypothetical protein [Gaiellaceae bacterium]
MALGLAFASVTVAGGASVAAAKDDPGTGGSRYVAAGGWSGMVDVESGIPLSAGIPEGDEQFIDEQAVDVIPYLSHGILTQAEADATAAQAIHDPYLTDVYVRSGESLGGADGLARADGDAIAFANAIESQQPTVIPYLSQGLLTKADADAAAAKTIHDPYPVSTRQPDVFGPNGDEIAFGKAIVAAADALHDPLTAATLGEALKSRTTSERFVPGVTDFPTTPQTAPDNRVERSLEQGPQVIPYLSQGMTSDDVVGARPDDRADRFAHSNVQPRPQMVSSDSGTSVEWNKALMVAIGALVLVLGLGLAFGYLRRPRLAGL